MTTPANGSTVGLTEAQLILMMMQVHRVPPPALAGLQLTRRMVWLGRMES